MLACCSLGPHPRANKAAFPSSHSQGIAVQDGKRGRGPKASRVRRVGQPGHTQDGGARAARSLRGGTSACAARSPGSGHKMAAAALGRARRRRQNGRLSRTCSRISSSPLRPGKSLRKPWPRREPRQGPGIRSRRRWPLRRSLLGATACPVPATAAILGLGIDGRAGGLGGRGSGERWVERPLGPLRCCRCCRRHRLCVGLRL